MRVGTKRKLITWGYLIGSSILLYAIGDTGNKPEPDIFFWLIWLNLIFTFWVVRIALRIQKALIPSLACKNCGTVLDLTGHWKCSCGYTLQRPRHAFDRCKNCGAKMGYFNCPKCDTSIDLI